MAHDHHDHAGQDHAHGDSPGDRHGHSHSHAPSRFGAAFAVGVALNLGLVATQVGVGVWAHSAALMADAVHNLGDALGLLIAWLAAWLGRRAPTARRTYGWGRGSILGALVNASVLLAGTGAIVMEAVQRAVEPGGGGGRPGDGGGGAGDRDQWRRGDDVHARAAR